jgi:hypothetical protein
MLLHAAFVMALWLLSERGLHGAEAGFEFEVGAALGREPVASVEVEQFMRPEKKSGLFKGREAAVVAVGVAVRFQKLAMEALDEIPHVVRARTNFQKVQMRRLALYAPGDPVPRLMAEEAVVLSNGVWALKKVLLADRPSAPECRLVWGKGSEPGVTFLRSKKTLPLSELLASRRAP